MKTIYLGSESKVKFNALNKALSEVLPPDQYIIVQRNVQSEVSEQPLGNETLRGATNRCLGCMFGCKYSENNEIYCIGIENGLYAIVREGVTRKNIDGMIECDNADVKYIDKAVIVVRVLDEGKYDETIWESTSVPVKDDYIPIDRDNETWGDRLCKIEKDEDGSNLTVDPKDPHYTVCSVSREDILYDVFKMIVRTVITQ